MVGMFYIMRAHFALFRYRQRLPRKPLSPRLVLAHFYVAGH
jgi:hypothetical protein